MYCHLRLVYLAGYFNQASGKTEFNILFFPVLKMKELSVSVSEHRLFLSFISVRKWQLGLQNDHKGNSKQLRQKYLNIHYGMVHYKCALGFISLSFPMPNKQAFDEIKLKVFYL